jgi:hypothetical protein
VDAGNHNDTHGIDDTRQSDLISFFAITFVIAWGILVLYIFASETMVRLFGNLTGQQKNIFSIEAPYDSILPCA